MYRRVEIAITLSLLVLGIGILAGAGQITRLPNFEDPIGARGFAYLIGAAIALLSGVLLASQLLRLRRGVTRWSEAEDPEITGDDPRYPATTRQAAAIVVAMFVAVVLLNQLGFIIAIGVFISAGIGLMGGRGVIKVAVYPVLFAVASYLLFDTLLNVRLPPGLLRPLLRAVGLE